MLPVGFDTAELHRLLDQRITFETDCQVASLFDMLQSQNNSCIRFS
jgi:hypothetical protein